MTPDEQDAIDREEARQAFYQAHPHMRPPEVSVGRGPAPRITIDAPSTTIITIDDAPPTPPTPTTPEVVDSAAEDDTPEARLRRRKSAEQARWRLKERIKNGTAPTKTEDCAKCGQVHVRCSAHKRHQEPLVPCMSRPRIGTTVCRMHGGSSPRVLAAAGRRVAESRAHYNAAELITKYHDGPAADPLMTLLEMVSASSCAVAAYGELVRRAGDFTHEVDYGKMGGVREEPTVLIKLWNDERDRLVKFSKAAVDAGVAEIQVKVAATQGQRMLEVFELALTNPRWGLTLQQKQLGRECIGEAVRRKSAA